MNRRYFINSGFLAFSGASLIPTSIIANDQKITLNHFGNGLNLINSQAKQVSITGQVQALKEHHEYLLQKLERNNYLFDSHQLTQLNAHCFVIPLYKKSILGFSSKELVFISKKKSKYNHFIIDEQSSLQLDTFINNFNHEIEQQQVDFINTFHYSIPEEIISYKRGRVSEFTFKNTHGNTISIISSKKGAKTIIK